MLVTHIYLNGQCKKAIELYKNAFNATIQTLIESPENEELVMHAEILIHNQLLMLNDFGNNDGFSVSGGYQLCVKFDSEDELMKSYSILVDGSKIITPLQATDFSACMVRFIDKYDVRWGFWL